jgi:UDP-glucuronate 4-epimerase
MPFAHFTYFVYHPLGFQCPSAASHSGFREGGVPLRVLVTGAAGFIGSHLTETLLNRGDQVIGLDNFNDYYDPSRKRINIAAVRDHRRLTFYEADIRDADKMHHIVADHYPDVVVHLAAMAGVRYSIGRAPLYVDVNLHGTVSLLEAVRGGAVPHFVFASTSSVYGATERIPFRETDACNHPLAPYPATKKASELIGYTYHNLHKLNFTALRFFSVYGPRGRPDMMPFMVMDRIVHGREIQLFDAGQMKRDWTYVDDIVAGVIAAVDRPLGYEIINLGRGEPVLMADFMDIIQQLMAKRAILSTPDAPPSEPKINFADISKARRLLEYNPQTHIRDGLARMWDWYQREILQVRSQKRNER